MRKTGCLRTSRLERERRSIRRTISEGESMAFNALVLDMHPYVAGDVAFRKFATPSSMFPCFT